MFMLKSTHERIVRDLKLRSNEVDYKNRVDMANMRIDLKLMDTKYDELMGKYAELEGTAQRLVEAHNKLLKAYRKAIATKQTKKGKRK